MVYCVRFVDIVTALAERGFIEAARTDATVIFQRDDRVRLIIHIPNENGHVPETLVNDAFDAAGLAPPGWDVFWCD